MYNTLNIKKKGIVSDHELRQAISTKQDYYMYNENALKIKEKWIVSGHELRQ